MRKIAGKRKRGRDGRKALGGTGSQQRGGDMRKKRKTHNKRQKIHTCNMCSYRTARKSSLTRHMHTHTGEKPYACSMCSYRAAQNCNLTTHMRTHTQVKDSKMMRRRPGVVTYL